MCSRSVEFELVDGTMVAEALIPVKVVKSKLAPRRAACKACVAPRTPWPQNGSSAMGVYQRMSNELEFEFGRCRTKTVSEWFISLLVMSGEVWKA